MGRCYRDGLTVISETVGIMDEMQVQLNRLAEQVRVTRSFAANLQAQTNNKSDTQPMPVVVIPPRDTPRSRRDVVPPDSGRKERARRDTMIPDPFIQGVHSKSCPCEPCISVMANELTGQDHY